MKKSFSSSGIAFMLFAAAFLALAIRTSAEPLPTKRPNVEILKVSHRGASRFAPENTIPAIEKALDFGFDYIEIDVRYAKDGVPVLMHDENVKRTTDGNGLISDMTLEEIKKLDASAATEWRGKFKDVRVPTLEEALRTIQGRASVYIDQKDPPRPILLSLLKQYGFYPDRCVIVGGNPNALAFLKLDPSAQILLSIRNVEDIPEILKLYPHPKAFNTTSGILSRELVEKAHSLGIMIFMNTLGFEDMPPIMKKVISAGVDAIQTDHPDDLLKVIAKIKKEREK
ncbi:MAG: glycerophosphodiester phosphodiesterase family protein [bacterium]